MTLYTVSSLMELSPGGLHVVYDVKASGSESGGLDVVYGVKASGSESGGIDAVPGWNTKDCGSC